MKEKHGKNNLKYKYFGGKSMSLIKEVATFRGLVLEHALNETSTGLPQFEVQVSGLERYDEDAKQWVDESGEEKEIRAFLVLFTHDNKPIFHYQSVQKVFGWDGQNFQWLSKGDFVGTPIQFRTKENDPEYIDKRPIVVASIDVFDAEPSRTMKSLDGDGVKKLNAKFAAGLRKASGGPKPKNVPPATPPKEKPKKTPPEKPATITAEKAWEICNERKPEKVTDEILANAWLEITEESGGDEKITKNGNWSEVCHVILEKIGVVDSIPF